MTEAKLRKYLKEWQPRLGLGHWDINLEVGELSPEHGAQCDRSHYYDEATITIAIKTLKDEFADYKPLDNFWWEKAIVHELLHCALRDFAYLPEIINHRLKKSDRKALSAAMTKAEEGIVDRMAEHLVRSYHAH